MSATAELVRGEARTLKAGQRRSLSGSKKTTPQFDASFLNGHMIRAMDYNDIYWKSGPVPSEAILIAAPLAICAKAKD